VTAVLEGQPAAPVYFARMKQVNKEGPRLVGELPAVGVLESGEMASELESGLLVVDLRPADGFAAGHVPGTINLPLNSAFLNWAGWLLPYDRPFALLGDPDQVATGVQRLRSIGLDTAMGFWTVEVLDAWRAAGRSLQTLQRSDAGTARTLIERGEVIVLDVRTPQEHAAGHITGSRNIPLSELSRRMDEVPSGRPIVVHCQGGTRSPIAASLLVASGRTNVIDLPGGFAHWRATGNPVARTEQAMHALVAA
jgi:hydroxyacylglutathione hydrolase